MDTYAHLLVQNPSKVPSNIQPDPRLVELKDQLDNMSVIDIRSKVLPLFLAKKPVDISNPYSSPTSNKAKIPPPILDKEKYARIMEQSIPIEVTRQLMWVEIIAEIHRVQQTGTFGVNYSILKIELGLVF